ncbi:unnamed protein product [Protopolystoma xenopodis]|uniref:Uncharacterized protein n=1 Tax=Protopolystoma xenopodis TaxID=117903 RepID=A0A3S5C3K3_9PLAT|nr:unnamed protein product [Protopolystoma xenopodis]
MHDIQINPYLALGRISRVSAGKPANYPSITATIQRASRTAGQEFYTHQLDTTKVTAKWKAAEWSWQNQTRLKRWHGNRRRWTQAIMR